MHKIPLTIIFMIIIGYSKAQESLNKSTETEKSEINLSITPKDTYGENYIYYDGDKNRAMIVIPSTKDSERAIKSTITYWGATIVSFGILYAMPEEVTNWDKEELRFDNIVSNWWNHVIEGPEVDNDNFFLNWVMHPYFGGVYYMSLRGAGYEWWESSLYSAAMSTFFWEYGIEAIAERPSVQDLIITPVVGSGVGELFYIAKKDIKSKNDKVLNSRVLGRTTLFLMDPLNEVQDIFIRNKMKNNDSSYKLGSEININNTLKPNLVISIKF